MKTFAFDKDAAVAAVLYIAGRVKEPTVQRICKLMYFADKAHLEQYGRLICGDGYVAMKHGPVPTAVYSILKAIWNGNSSFIDGEIMAAFKKALNVVNGVVKPLGETELDALSDSDIKCLEGAIGAYGDKSFAELMNASRDLAWENADEHDFIDVEIIAAMFANKNELLGHLRDPFPG